MQRLEKDRLTRQNLILEADGGVGFSEDVTLQIFRSNETAKYSGGVGS